MKKLAIVIIAFAAAAGARAEEQTEIDTRAINVAFNQAVSKRNAREGEPGLKGRAWVIDYLEDVLAAFVLSQDTALLETETMVRYAVKAAEKSYPHDAAAEHVFFAAAISQADEIIGRLLEERPMSLENISEEIRYCRQQLSIK